MIYSKIIKPLLDFFIAIIALLILSPILIIIFVILTIANRGGAFFFQERPGKKGLIFKVIKFKTMNDLKDINGELLPDHQRINKIGKFIRSTSLDEVPQLINVVKGDMSLIGPRPLLVKYLSLYTIEQAKRHDVKPGITGWAQVNGRNTISWNKKFELDVWYVQNKCFILDCKIIILTLKKVIIREGVSSDTNITMEPFKGNN